MNKNILFILLTSVVMLFTAVEVIGQQFRVSSLPTQKQMPVANVHHIMQDSEGYMWYATKGGGLCRDNGYQIDIFRIDDNDVKIATGNSINTMMEDVHGNIWVGTQRGVFRIDKSRYRMEPVYIEPLGQSGINIIKSDKRGRLWIGNGGIMVQLDSTNSVQHTFRFEPYHASCIVEDRRGQIWAGLWGGGLSIYDEASEHFENKLTENLFVTAIIEGQGNSLWLATLGDGILHYDTDNNIITQQNATMGTRDKQQVIDCLRDSKHGLFWVTTMDDLYLYQEQNGQLEAIDRSTFLPEGRKIVDHLAEDSEGNIWVAGFSPTTFIVSPNTEQIVRYDVPDMQRLTGFPLLADRVVADEEGFWIWQGRWGLTLFTPKDGQVRDEGRNYSACIERCRHSNGIWATQGHQLLHITRNGARPMLNLEEDITYLYAQENDVLWIGSTNGLYRYSVLGGKLEKTADTDGIVNSIAVNPDGHCYYIVKRKGLFGPDGLIQANSNMTALAFTDDGTLWIGTEHGNVYRMEEGKLLREELACNELGDAVKDMMADETGHLWVLSDLQVKEVNPRLGSMRTIHADDPFIHVSYFYCLEPYDGHHVILCGAGAFCIIKSSSALNRTGSQVHTPVVTAVQMADSLHLTGMKEHKMEVPTNVGSITLRLSTLEHLNANKIMFAYRIEGWQKEWIYLPQGSNLVHLNYLPKGNHALMVKCTDSNGCWGDPVEVIVICKMPFWWETWWARTLFVLLIVLFVWGLRILRYRIRQLRELQRKRKEIVLNEIELNPQELKSSKIDGEFLQRAVLLVEKNIRDVNYNVARFSNDMCMSRMNLYRKLHMLTGLSPSEFMRDIRLKKAAQMILSRPTVPINEIAAKVGFSTPGYFTKCFKEMFGVLPTQYGKFKQ